MKLQKSIWITAVSLLCLFTNAQAQLPAAKNKKDMKQESLVAISAFTAIGNLPQLKTALNEGLEAGLSIAETKEVLVQLYAYAGFPRSLNAIGTLETVVNERREKGKKDIEGAEPAPQKFEDGRFAFGKKVQTELTGTTAIGSAQKFVPVIDSFLKEHLFADIFSRDNLDYQTREIVTIAALASMDGTESQLKSHLNVGKNVGLTEAQLRSIASTISTKVGRQHGNTASKLIDAMFHAKDNDAATENEYEQNHLDLQNEGANTSKKETMKDTQQNAIFPQGEKAPPENFTGTVWVNRLAKQDVSGTYSVGNVMFEAGARTNWHTHAGGQTLIVTDGVGWYQEKGKPARSIHKGDVVLIPADVVHWHGASKDSSLTHIALTNLKDGSVKWLELVNEEEYNLVSK